MASVATCKVNRRSTQWNEDWDRRSGFQAESEKDYEGNILGFETLKAYVVRDDNQKVYLVDIQDLTEVVPV